VELGKIGGDTGGPVIISTTSAEKEKPKTNRERQKKKKARGVSAIVCIIVSIVEFVEQMIWRGGSRSKHGKAKQAPEKK